MRGVWIEIQSELKQVQKQLSLPMRGVWIEIKSQKPTYTGLASLPMRGVWIEITAVENPSAQSGVTPHAGSVD